jgi:FkbM family methyltransferase
MKNEKCPDHALSFFILHFAFCIRAVRRLAVPFRWLKLRAPWRRRQRVDRSLASYALDELDLKLARELESDVALKSGGFFIEAGANDGVTQSNTFLLERDHNWRGLLIEPIPDLARRCRQNRPGCIVENAALVPAGHAAKTVEMTYCNLMSQVKGAMKSAAEEADHIRRGKECQQIETYTAQVPARTLSQILDAHRIEQVDLLSLDVEGFELAALQGIDYHRHAPRWMLIEARYRQEIDGFLRPWYDVSAVLSHHDVLYRRKANWQAATCDHCAA